MIVFPFSELAPGGPVVNVAHGSNPLGVSPLTSAAAQRSLAKRFGPEVTEASAAGKRRVAGAASEPVAAGRLDVCAAVGESVVTRRGGSRTIDINSDLGESFGAYRMGADEDLLVHVSSANVACGFHAGDPRTMDRTVGLAVAAKVVVGAHVSYPDLVGFGRRHMRVSAEELIADVLFQIGALDAFCRRHKTSVHHVKAHGALYNDLAEDERLAGALADAVLAYGDLAVLVLAGTPAVEVLQKRGVRVVREGFADRAYTPEGRLVSRREPGALITDPDAVAERSWRIASGQPVEASDGSQLIVDVDSICVHGDTPGAVELIRAVRRALADHAVEVAPFP